MLVLQLTEARACPGNANFTFPNPHCPGGPVTFTNTSTGGADSYTWVWGDASPNTTVNNISSQNHVYSTAGSYTVILIRTFSNGCVDSLSQTITIANNPPPAPAFTYTPNGGCSTNPFNFTVTSPTPGFTYSWNFGDPSSSQNTATGTNANHQFNAIGNGSSTYTVTLTGTSPQGCFSSSTQTIIVGNRPDAALADSNIFAAFNNCSFASTTNQSYLITVMNASTTTSSNANYTIDWGDSSPPFSSSTFNTTSHTYASLGIYTILLTVTGANGCVDTAAYQVVNLSNPSVGLTGPGNTSGCAPQTYQFTLSPDQTNAAYTSYTFDFGDGSPPVTWNPPITSTTISHTYSVTSCGQPGNQFTVKVTARNACDSTTSTVNSIKISSRPQSSFTASPNPGCINIPVVFTNNTTPGCYITGSSTITASSFVWDFGDGSPVVTTSSTAPQSHTYTTVGTYTVTLTSSNPCGNTVHTEEIHIIGPPLASFTNSPPGCAPSVITVNNTSTLDSLNYNWTVSPASGWSFSNGTNSSLNPEFTFTAAGTYTITLTVSNPCSTSVATSVITVKDVPSVSLSPIPNACGSATISPNAVYTAGGGTISAYNWNFPGATPATSTSQTPTGIVYSTPGTYTITATATNECGIASDNEQFTVMPLPVADAGNDTSICAGQSVSIGSAPLVNYTYSWSSNPPGFSSGLSNPVVTPTITTTYVVTAFANGCTQTDTVTVTVNPLPVVVAGTPQTVCIDASPFNISGSSPAGGTFSGTGISNAANGTFDPAAAGTGTHTITYSYTDPGTNCSNAATVNITVVPLPVVSAGSGLTLCNQPGTVALSGYSPAGGTWSGAAVTAGGIFDPAAAGNGMHVLTYTFTDANSCSSSDTIHINVINPTPAQAGADDTLCVSAGAITLTGFSPGGGTWSGAGITSPAGVFDPAVAGTGVHSLVYTFGTGTCQTTDTIEITVDPLPLVTAGANESVCIDSAAYNLSGFSPAGGTWSGTGVTPSGNFDPAAAGAGTHTLTYSYTDPVTGCTNTATKTITVNPLPVVNAGTGFMVCNQPVTVTLSGFSPGGGTWSGPGVTTGGVFDPSAAGNGIHILTYIVTNANGCVNSDTIQMNVISPAVAQAGPNDTVCVSAGAFTLTGSSPAGGSWSGPGITASSGTFDPSVAGVGAHTITYTYGTGTCQTTSTKTVIVDPLPVINAGPGQTICLSDAPFSLTGYSPTGGTWTGSGITNAAAGTFDPSVAGTGTFTVTYHYTDPGTGCGDSAATTVVVNALPIVNAGTGFTVCDQPITVTLTGYSPPGGSWSGPGVSTGGAFDPSVAGVGTHTLTYTFSNGNGCTNTDTIQMTVVAPAVAQAGVDDTICLNTGIVTLTGFTPAGGTWSGPGVAGNTFDPSVAGVGTHTLTYTYGAGTCLTSDTKTVHVHPIPVVNAGSAETVCVSTPAYSLAGYSPAGGTWSGAGITNAAGTFDPSTAGVGAHTLTYTYTDPVTNCTNTAVKSVVVGALPVPAFANPLQVCEGSPVSFTDNSTGAVAYYWSFGDGGLSSVQNPVYTYADTGTYTVQLIAETPYGCLDSITGTIEVYEPPQALFTSSPDSGCGPLTVNFTNQSTGELVSYSWDFGNGQTSTLQNPGPVTYLYGLYDTVYYVTLTVNNFCGSVTYVDSVLVHPPPIAYFGTNVNSGCSPLTLQFNNFTIYGMSYFWDLGDGTTSTALQPQNNTYYYTGATDTTYYITLIASNVCGSDTFQHNVTVYPNNVTAFFNMDVTSGCVPVTVNFTDYSTGGNVISWDFGDGNISSIQNPSHTYTQPGTYTVSQFVNNGCSFDTITAQVTVYPLAGLSFTAAPIPACVDQPIVFTNTSTNASGYSWDFGDGDSSAVNSPSHAYTAPGTYTITLTGTSTTYGCISSITGTVNVTPLPVPQFTPDISFGCAPLTVNFQNNSSNASFNSWDFGDGNTSIVTNPSHTYTTPGIYDVTLVVQNLAGCLDSMIVQINVYPDPVAAFTLSSTVSCSVPVTVNLINTSSGATGYQWDLGNSQTSTLNNPSVTYTANGTYSISLIATNSYGCSDTASYTYGIYPSPVISYTPNITEGCEDLTVAFSNQTQFASTYYWIFGDGDTSTLATPTHVYDVPGTYNVTLIATSTSVCADTLTLTTPVMVYPTPVADFNYAQLYSDGIPNGTIELTNTTVNGVTYDWSFGDGLESTEVHPFHQYPEPGDYTVTLISENEYNCIDTTFQLVNVEYFQGLYIPNAFIPASQFPDLQTFMPRGKSLKEYHIQVYNTWGTLLWESTALDQFGSPSEGWDGTFNGEPCQQDVYVWKVQATFLNGSIWGGKKYPNGEIKNTGTITLIR